MLRPGLFDKFDLLWRQIGQRSNAQVLIESFFFRGRAKTVSVLEECHFQGVGTHEMKTTPLFKSQRPRT